MRKNETIFFYSYLSMFSTSQKKKWMNIPVNVYVCTSYILRGIEKNRQHPKNIFIEPKYYVKFVDLLIVPGLE